MAVTVVHLIRLLSEVGLLAGAALGGWHLGPGRLAPVAALTAVAVAVAIWGRWIAPRARRRLPDPARLLTEVALFSWSAAGLVIAGHRGTAIVLVALALPAAVAIRWAGEPVGAPGSDEGAATR